MEERRDYVYVFAFSLLFRMFLEVEVTDLLPNTHYYIRPYVTTEEGTGYGPVVEFTTESGTEPIIDYFTMYIATDRSVNLYATFYTAMAFILQKRER